MPKKKTDIVHQMASVPGLGDGHYVTDLHATVLRLLGLDSRQLQIPGRKRLEIDYGKPITEIMA